MLLLCLPSYQGNLLKKKLGRIFRLLYARYGPQDWWPGDTPFEVAVGAVLTQNTNWGNVERAIANLKKAKALSAKRIHLMPHDELASLIRPAGYFNVKARRLKSFVSHLALNHGGSMKKMARNDADSLRRELLWINGIGPETADSMLLYALGKPVFVIDAYTRRVLERHGITNSGMDYHEAQSLFHECFKPDVPFYNEYHALFVMVGKDYCRPSPRCEGCPLKRL